MSGIFLGPNLIVRRTFIRELNGTPVAVHPRGIKDSLSSSEYVFTTHISRRKLSVCLLGKISGSFADLSFEFLGRI